MSVIKSDRVRVYFNRHGDPSRLWSVDQGPGTPEIQCSCVTLSDVHGVTEVADPKPSDPDNQPSAWLTVESCKIHQWGDGVVRLGPQFVRE